MKVESLRNQLGWISIFGAVATTLIITPTFSSEPINIPKLMIMGLFAFLILGVVLNRVKSLFSKADLAFLGISGFFFVDLILVLFFSGSSFNEQFFGTYGRNTGFLSYVCLLIFMMCGYLISSDILNIRILSSLVIVGIISSAYGLIQFFNHDPIKWNNPYNRIIGFVGNPDFASSLMGICTIASFALMLKHKFNWGFKSLLLLLNFVTIYLIIKSRAQQGMIVLGLGFVVTLWVFVFWKSKAPRLFFWLFSLFVVTLGSFVVLGSLNTGPLSFLYKVSVRQRGFYWSAAMKMLVNNPVFGIGLDSYGDNYLKYRSSKAAFYSLQTQSNAAHNVVLDFASNGGFPLLLSYLSILLYALFVSLRYIRNMSKFDINFSVIFAAWVGYQAQSIISINQLGLAIWGWLLTGVLIGYGKVNSPKVEKVSSRKRSVKSNKGNLAVPLICLSLGILLFIPPFLADRNYRNASASRNAQELIKTAKSYPEDYGRTIQVASLLANSKLNDLAIQLSEYVISKNPKNYNANLLLLQLTSPDSSKHKKALSQIKVLNPFDKTLK